MLGGVETGGTNVVCAVGTGPDDVRATERFETTTPQETVERVVAFFAGQEPIAALGVASFGPIDGDPASPTWGHVTTTPKPGWAGTPLAPTLRDRLGVPVAFETDVNAAALAEHRWGAGQGHDRVVYVTVGTGIGAGVVIDGRTVGGAVHPEAGHLRIPRDAADEFPGACPFHGDCWEGLASGPAIAARWGAPAHELPASHEAWALEARYVALGVFNVALTLAPGVVVLGGGVMSTSGLLDQVRRQVEELAAAYQPMPPVRSPALGGRQGVLGAIAAAAPLA